MFNAERAWKEAEELRRARLDSMPTDTTVAQGLERQKYDRVIEKCSRTLERFPDEVKQKPRAVFLIAESFRQQGQYTKAVQKYDEFERYFADHDSMTAAEYQRAWCLYKNRDFPLARFAVDRVIESGEEHPYYFDGLNLLALLEEHAEMPDLAISALEKILASENGTPFLRAKIHIRLGDLYFKEEKWEMAYKHYTHEEVKHLEEKEQMLALAQGAECLFNLKRYAQAAKEYEKVMLAHESQSILWMKQIVRWGEMLYAADDVDRADSALYFLTQEKRRSVYASKAWFVMGDYAQMRLKNFAIAVDRYDSSWTTGPGTEWGREASSRAIALRELLALRTVKDTTGQARERTSEEEFQIAELFLFKLSEIDSALLVLDRLLDSGGIAEQDSPILPRAAYARAFLYDEYKDDEPKADSLYRAIIANYPGTEFAQRSQANLGMRITELTPEDLAHLAFLQAESLMTVVTEKIQKGEIIIAKNLPDSAQTEPIAQVPLPDSTSMDSAKTDLSTQTSQDDSMQIAEENEGFAPQPSSSLLDQALAAYDSVWKSYPETERAVQALYALAHYTENYTDNVNEARRLYAILRAKHRATPWGEAADYKLSSRLVHSDKDIERLRRRVEQNKESADRMRKQYEEEQKRMRSEEREAVQMREAADEVLQDDYNTMYDFE